MLRTLGFTVLLFISSSFASATCPDLKGTYLCTDSAESSANQLEITQTTEAGITTYYQASGQPIFADNQTYYLPDQVGFVNATRRSYCSNNAVRTEFTGQVVDERGYHGDLFAVSSFYLNAAGDLVDDLSGHMKRPHGTEPFQFLMICRRASSAKVKW